MNISPCRSKRIYSRICLSATLTILVIVKKFSSSGNVIINLMAFLPLKYRSLQPSSYHSIMQIIHGLI